MREESKYSTVTVDDESDTLGIFLLVCISIFLFPDNNDKYTFLTYRYENNADGDDSR